MVLDFRVIDTTPGAEGPFAPPADWVGQGAEDYRELLRTRWRDVRHGQRMAVAARYYRIRDVSVSVEGPWADEAHAILKRLSGVT